MTLTLTKLEEILSRYKKMNAYATEGEFDKEILDKLKLNKILNLKLIRNFHSKNYAYSFARKRFNKEAENGLNEMRVWYRLLNDKLDDPTPAKALELIDNYLEKIHYVKKKNILEQIFSEGKAVLAIIPLSIIVSAFTIAKPYLAILLLIGIMLFLPLGIWLIINKMSLSFMEKYFYSIIQEKFHIAKLKDEIIKELKDYNVSSEI